MNFRTSLLTNNGTTNSVITDITDRYKPIITVVGVGGDFSHTPRQSTSRPTVGWLATLYYTSAY